MLLYGEVEHDARVRREATTLVGRGYDVTIATLALRPTEPFELDGAHVVPLRPARRGLVPGDESPFRSAERPNPVVRLYRKGRWAFGYWTTYRNWAGAAREKLAPADVWHGHDLLGLLAARGLARKHGGALIHDSHELFLEAGSAARLPGPARRILFRAERGATRAAAAVITVNDSIAAELHRRYGVDPVVVMNCPPLSTAPAKPVMRKKLGLGKRPTVIHHGVLGPGRGIDILVGAIPDLPPQTAVVLLGNGPLAADLAEAAKAPAYRDRLYVVPAVPMTEVAAWLADADVGVIPFQAVDRNNVLGTPNKLFEYMAAGVPVVVSDFPEMRRIVAEIGAGLAVDTTDPRRLAGAIADLLAEPPAARKERRARERAAAETAYNWEAQARKLTAIYERLDKSRD
jgi:glycosyltransferase involved in cell wall biosynthesis